MRRNLFFLVKQELPTKVTAAFIFQVSLRDVERAFRELKREIAVVHRLSSTDRRTDREN